MGMIGSLLAIDRSELELFKGNNELIEKKFNETYRSEDRNTNLTIETLWQVIHFLLCGEPWNGDSIEAMVILGGNEIGGDEFGPATYIDENEVKVVSEMLLKIDVNKLKEKYDPKKLEENNIYPRGIWEDDVDEVWEEIAEMIKEIIDFYKKSAERNKVVIKWLSF